MRKNDKYELPTEIETLPSSRRDENSLYTLTKRFIQLIYEAPDKHINMTQASCLLNVSKRRIYDITNVLECLGMISKWSVNDVKWIGGSVDGILEDNRKAESTSKYSISAEEKAIDREIEKLNKEITELSMDQKSLENAYVTYDDLQRLKIYKDKLVFAVKVPADTKIEYPRYEKGYYRLRIMAEKGQISVYYLNEDPENK